MVGQRAQQIALPGQRLLRLLALGDVHVRAEHPDGAVLCVAQHLAVREDPAIGTVLVPQPELDLIRWPRRREAAAHALHDAVVVLRVQALLPFLEAAGQIRVRVAELALPLRREIDLVRLNVPVPEPGVGGLDGELQAGLRFQQHRLRLLAVGDVHVRAEHAVGLALRVTQHLAVREDPAVGAVLVAQPKLAREGRPRRGHRRLDGGQLALAVLGMQARLPVRKAVGQFLVAAAEVVFALGREIDLVRQDVPVPQAGARGVDGQLQAGLGLAQRGLRTPQRRHVQPHAAEEAPAAAGRHGELGHQPRVHLPIGHADLLDHLHRLAGGEDRAVIAAQLPCGGGRLPLVVPFADDVPGEDLFVRGVDVAVAPLPVLDEGHGRAEIHEGLETRLARAQRRLRLPAFAGFGAQPGVGRGQGRGAAGGAARVGEAGGQAAVLGLERGHPASELAHLGCGGEGRQWLG